MSKTRQELLDAIRRDYCGGRTAELAQRIGRDYSYVHRLFLEPEKRRHKGIGLEIMEACDKAFNLPPGYWNGASQAADQAASLVAGQINAHQNDLASPYARLLANTFDALGMEPETAKAAFVAATQVLINHSGNSTAKASAAPGATATPASTLPGTRLPAPTP